MRERDLEWRSKLSEKQNVSPQLFPCVEFVMVLINN